MVGHDTGVSAMAAEIDAARAFAQIFAPLEQAMGRQSDLFDILSWMSPLVAADRAADVPLGVSDRHQFSFEARAEAMRVATQMALNEGWARSDRGARGTPEIWRNVVEAADAVRAVPPGPGYTAAGLAIWLLVCVAGLGFTTRALRKSI